MSPISFRPLRVTILVFVFLGACTSVPDKPLPKSWKVPGIGHEVLRKGLAISRQEAEQLSAEIVARLQKRWQMGNDYSFELLMHDADGLDVQVNEGTGCFLVELKKVVGKWRIWRLKEPFYEGPLDPK